MNKFSLWMFYIFTFGIGYIVLKNKAKKQATLTNTELTVTHTIPIDVNQFISYVGGIENITSTSASISSIKLNVNDTNIIDVDSIKKIGAKGVMLSDKCVTCLFGDFSKELSNKINSMI
ncbi:hypothetical protein [Malacoplasma muris]|uniref:hypothetical protein n=1 Tax=Malacoplasma muris TaxID=2119 RepID=UPI00398F8DEB